MIDQFPLVILLSWRCMEIISRGVVLFLLWGDNSKLLDCYPQSVQSAHQPDYPGLISINVEDGDIFYLPALFNDDLG